MTRPYSVFLHLEVTEALRSLPRREVEGFLRFAQSLARDPFQPGDFQEYDDRHRANDVKVIGRLAVVYYVDNADREVRVLEVRRADS